MCGAVGYGLRGNQWVRDVAESVLSRLTSWTHIPYTIRSHFFVLSLYGFEWKFPFFLSENFLSTRSLTCGAHQSLKKKGTFTVLCTAKESCCCYFNNEIIPTWILLFDFDERKRLIIIIIIIKRLSFSTENCPWGRWQERKISKHGPIIKAEIIFHQFVKGEIFEFCMYLDLGL